MYTKSNIEVDRFFEFASRHPKLFWNARNTGCEAKADLIAELAFERGFEVTKIWIRPLNASDSFLVYLNEAGTEVAAWNYHVAVELKITDNESDNLIIDPSLFDKAVDLDKWKERLSLLSSQYGVVLEIIKSKREAFFGPEDFLNSSNRRKALAKREEILNKAFNINDPIIFDGIMMKLRGAFVDALMKSDSDSYNKLRVSLRNDAFENWFKHPIPHKKLESQLNKHSYYGIDTSQIKNSINLSNIDASVRLKEKFWKPVSHAIKVLAERAEGILSGGFNTETMTFKIEWEDNNFRRSWFSPSGNHIWNRYGLSSHDLQNGI